MWGLDTMVQLADHAGIGYKGLTKEQLLAKLLSCGDR